MRVRFDQEQTYNFLLCIFINILPILDMILNVYQLNNENFQNKEIIQNGLYSILILLMIIILNKRISVRSMGWLLLTIIISATLFIFSRLLTPGISEIVVHSYLTFLILVVFTTFAICQVKDYEKFIRMYELFYPFLLIYAFVVILAKNKLPHGYSMNFSYNSFFISGISLFQGVRQKKILKIIVFVITLGTNLIAGARGALLCDIILILLILAFINERKSSSRKLINIFVMVVLGSVFIFNVPIIARILYVRFPSRTLELLADGRLSVLSGREIYYQSLIKELGRNPLAIRGLLADRVYMASILGLPKGIIFSAYAHNFILELLFQFGTILGSFIVIFVLYKSIGGLIKAIQYSSKCTYFVMFYILSFSYAFGQLMFSNSYLISNSVGMLMACILMLKHELRE